MTFLDGTIEHESGDKNPHPFGYYAKLCDLVYPLLLFPYSKVMLGLSSTHPEGERPWK
jgi:hypothetical protein